MSTRHSSAGQLINRQKPIEFSFNGRKMRGFEGDTLASALLANDQMLMGRSFKYHRPRGVVGSGAEEPNALMNLGEGARFEPNQRATTTELFEGLTAKSQNHFPSLEFDIGVVNSYLSRFLSAGFYYKMFIHPRPFWKHIYEPFIRQSAGLGKAPDAETKDADRYEHFYAHVDIAVVGGGIAGLQAALAAARSGAEVLLMEQNGYFGGRAIVDGTVIDEADAQIFVTAALNELEQMPNVTVRRRMMGAGIYDHGYLVAYERLKDHTPLADGPRHRLWKIRAQRIITATGAVERPLSFAANDLPGVMLANAVRDYIVNYGVSVGDRVVIVTNNDDAYKTALALLEAGLQVPAIIDTRAEGAGAIADVLREKSVHIENGKAIVKAVGKKRVTGAAIGLQEGEGAVLETIPCDAIAMSGGWSPIVHLWSHCGGKLSWDENELMYVPDPKRPPLNQNGDGFVLPCGAAQGHFDDEALLKNAAQVGKVAAKDCGHTPSRKKLAKAEAMVQNPISPVWMMPQGAKTELRAKAWLDFQNDVKVGDVQLAAREGYESVEHTKRYTTLGMATDQGKLSNINGLAILADSLSKPIPQVGTTTFRPPYTPISMGSIAGEARAETFQPLRRTPMHDWHEENNAFFEPVGLWRRPYCYPRNSETHADAVVREINQTRSSLGILDASTLGKLIVKGPDAGKFLDMMYTNMMSTLKVGRCRYGLMCSENGFLMDDGVVARIDEETFLCHTTSGGADHIHGHFEEWLQTEWWDFKVYTANVTEQYAQIAVVGPNARACLEKLGGLDVTAEALPFMGWLDGTLAGIPVRAYRISFSGELSYEIAVPAEYGRALWDAILGAGAAFDIMPYGTEALHVMRAEKGFIMIGDETDGTVIPQDLNLNWAISKKKTDFIGKRAQEREHMISPKRWKLVGLQAEDGSVIPEGAYVVDQGVNANGQRNTQGRITSTYYSPTLECGIAMGLVLDGPDRMGQSVGVTNTEGDFITATIVDPVFYDKEGAKQNV